MRVRRFNDNGTLTLTAGIAVALIVTVGRFHFSDAAHESVNVLVFGPPAGALGSASGSGQITYPGGPPEASR